MLCHQPISYFTYKADANINTLMPTQQGKGDGVSAGEAHPPLTAIWIIIIISDKLQMFTLWLKTLYMVKSETGW